MSLVILVKWYFTHKFLINDFCALKRASQAHLNCASADPFESFIPRPFIDCLILFCYFCHLLSSADNLCKGDPPLIPLSPLGFLKQRENETCVVLHVYIRMR